MTGRELRELEQMLGHAPKPTETAPLDREQVALALRTVDQLDQSVGLVEETLRQLGVQLEDFTLPKALIGSLGISVTEIRSQLPALREAAKEVGK